MGAKTGIAWTDSTYNYWIGCAEVGPGCDFCYARGVGKRLGVEWGHGVDRYLTSLTTRNAPYLWNKRADAFIAKHGHAQRVFCGSLMDWADKEVPGEWRAEMWKVIHNTPRLRWQLCTKRVTNIGKMLPVNWDPKYFRHVGFLITCVNQEEADRDIPRLLDLKLKHDFAWVGVSYEPALGPINWRHSWMADAGGLAWIICGGESGSHARDDNPGWYRSTELMCKHTNTAFFMKQMAHLRPIPDDLMIREFPVACG